MSPITSKDPLKFWKLAPKQHPNQPCQEIVSISHPNLQWYITAFILQLNPIFLSQMTFKLPFEIWKI